MAQTTPTTSSSGSTNRQSGQSGVSGSTSAMSQAGVGMTSGAAMGNRSEFSNNQFIDKLKDVDVRGTMRDLQRRGREYVSESERYIRANPLRVVLSAAGIGMIIGFLMRGSRVVSR